MQNSKEEKINGISLHIGYNFDNPQLIHNALTRRSAIIENTLDAFHSSNLRLEFIGDTLLNFIIGEIVYDTFQSGNESDLTAYRAGILATDTLGEFLIQKDIGKFMIVGRGEEQNLITINNGHKYIFQIRFGNCPLWTNNFATWYQNNKQLQNFGEWSNNQIRFCALPITINSKIEKEENGLFINVTITCTTSGDIPQNYSNKI